MRLFATSLLIVLIASAQSDQGFSGAWKLNRERSEIRNLPVSPDPFLRVEQSGTALTLFASSQEGGAPTISNYPLDQRTEKRQVGNITTSTVTKWEGAALLVNRLVSGPQNYTVMERWKRSRDGNTLTLTRSIVRIRALRMAAARAQSYSHPGHRSRQSDRRIHSFVWRQSLLPLVLSGRAKHPDRPRCS